MRSTLGGCSLALAPTVKDMCLVTYKPGCIYSMALGMAPRLSLDGSPLDVHNIPLQLHVKYTVSIMAQFSPMTIRWETIFKIHVLRCA